jgi:hypothetical protein
LNDADVGPFLTELNDIESYFLNAEHIHALNPGVALERIHELLMQATEEAASKSVEAIVNQRTEEAFQVRQNGGPTPNHGAIAVEAQTDYAADPIILRRGKKVIGRFQALLQQELGNTPRIYFPTIHLQSDVLRALALKIWPPQ